MITMRHGGITGRPGTQYVGTAQNAGSAVRLIPFIFNETGTGQSYVLEFGNLYIGFYQNGGVVTSGGVPYTIVSPYAQADLATLHFAESADVVTIVHPSYAPRELRRLGATNWTLSTITLFSNDTNNYITSTTMTGTAGAPDPWNQYIVTSVNSKGEETALNAFMASVATARALALAALATPVSLQWTAPVNGAVLYRVYVCTQHGVGSPPYAQGPLGFVGQTTDHRFVDTGFTPDYSQQPPNFNNVFSGAGDYPSAVGYIQQRRAFAATTNNPIGFWLSVPGDYANFDVSVPVKDSDGVIGAIAGDEVNSIQHISELKFMLLLTAGAEIYVQGNGNGVVAPSAINASIQSQYGSGPLRPLKVGDILLFNQALGSFVRDFGFDFAIDGYRGNDITVFASHLFEGYTLSDWAYQKVPDSIIWAARSDGTLLSCTYVREQQVLAWARHDFTNGTVENVCSIPENGQYAVYLSIKRVINGSTVRYIERMASRIWTDVLNATYLDCFSSYNGVNTGATSMTLTASGSFQTGITAYTQQLTLTASAAFFTSNMVGNQIVLSDADFVAALGNTVDPENPGTGNVLPAAGYQVRLTIQAYTSSTVVTVTPSSAVPTDLQNTALTTWARAVASVTGLNYLAGQQVSVWADRFVVGSPNNYHVPTVYTVSLTGTLTLDKPYSVIYVGLPMTQDVQTLDLETSGGESNLARRKRAAQLAIYLLNTRTFFAGTEDPAANLANTAGQALFQLYELRTGEYQTRQDLPPGLLSTQESVLFESRYNKNGRLFIRNVDPTPLTILAIAPQAETPAQNPMLQKV